MTDSSASLLFFGLLIFSDLLLFTVDLQKPRSQSVSSLRVSYNFRLCSSTYSSYCSHIRELRSIRPYLDLKIASSIVTSIVHSKRDYYNSLYCNLPKSQLNTLQNIQDSLARAVDGDLNPLISLLFSSFYISSKLGLLEALNVNLFLSRTRFLLLPNLHNFITSTLLQHPLFIQGHSCSGTNMILFKNHKSLFSVCITLSTESTSR